MPTRASEDVFIFGLPINEHESYLPQSLCRKSCGPGKSPFWTDEEYCTLAKRRSEVAANRRRETAKANGRLKKTHQFYIAKVASIHRLQEA